MASFDQMIAQQRNAGLASGVTSVELPTRKDLEDSRLGSQHDEPNVAQDAPVYKDTTTLEHEVSVVGDGAAKKKKKKKPIDGAQTKKTRSDTVQIPAFPRELIAAVRKEFPMATNNTDALSAYVYVKTGRTCDVPDEIKELAKDWKGDNTLEMLENRLHNLERQSTGFMAVLSELELGVGYMMHDRLGFRRDNPKDARSANLLEDGVGDMISRLREQTKQYRQQENIKHGRPIR